MQCNGSLLSVRFIQREFPELFPIGTENLCSLSSTFVFLALSLTTAEDEELCIIIICLLLSRVRNG